MKKFSAKVQYVTLNYQGNLLGIEEIPILVRAESRGDAILKMCDVGQAIARSANDTNTQIFFRIVEVTEIGVA